MIQGMSNFKVVKFNTHSPPEVIERTLQQANIPMEMQLIHGYNNDSFVVFIFAYNATSVLNNMMSLTEQLNDMLGHVESESEPYVDNYQDGDSN